MPKYSFVIPTKNRSHLIGGAINSILRQTAESDFEIIILDNDDSDQTSNVVSQFNDSRIRYIRTGGIGMAQNCRVGLDSAQGEWVLFLQDKHRIKKNALEIIDHNISKSNSEVISWLAVPDWMDPEGPAFYVSYQNATKCSSKEILLNISEGNSHEYFDKMPKLVNSAIKKTLIHKINQINNQALCSPISFDMTSAFSILLNIDSFQFLNCSLTIIPPNSPSQGDASQTRAKGFDQFIYDMGLMPEDAFSFVPVKYLSLQNSIFNDYAKCVALFNKTLEHPINLAKYYNILASEALSYLENKTPFDKELKILRNAFKSETKKTRHDSLMLDFRDAVLVPAGKLNEKLDRIGLFLKKRHILGHW